MASITSLRRHIGMKTHPTLVETLIAARKQKGWRPVAQKLAGSTRRHSAINLSMLDKKAKEGDTIIVTGKVLGTGNVTKRFRVCAMSFSQSALQKLKTAKIEIVPIIDEIKKNPKAEGIIVLT